MAKLYAGTSGFAYPSWKPDFYPANVPSRKFLEHYSQRLNIVEINYTFRRLPSAATLEGWVKATPPDFLFAPKAHMRITHILRLKDAGAATDLFLRAVDPLRPVHRLGPILFQLPPGLKCDTALLADFLTILPRDMRFAVEFRHESWLTDAVYGLLTGHNVSLCVAESEKLEVPEVVTADFIYYRLRKPEYSPDERRAIEARSRELVESGKDLFLFFKHEDTPHGALYAEELLNSVHSGAG
jgi:uncharacterized protein YecE (DUF72 family)